MGASLVVDADIKSIFLLYEDQTEMAYR